MIEIELTPTERRLIHHWIECMREESSHRGDGDAVFPDERIVEGKLDHAGPVRLTRRHLEEILDWSESSHQSIAFTAEEVMLIPKIKNALFSV
ncbi:MAG TPA: hypothetical protein VM658_21510 [bacterium]|nr:hypothetical protein [bacterium]